MNVPAPGVLQHMPLCLSVPWHDTVGASEWITALLWPEPGRAGLEVSKLGNMPPKLWDVKVVDRQPSPICELNLQNRISSLTPRPCIAPACFVAWVSLTEYTKP